MLLKKIGLSPQDLKNAAARTSNDKSVDMRKSCAYSFDDIGSGVFFKKYWPEISLKISAHYIAQASNFGGAF